MHSIRCACRRLSRCSPKFTARFGFSTPISDQTNTLVYSAGNDRFSDFARLGIPMKLPTWAAASLLIPLSWPFQPG